MSTTAPRMIKFQASSSRFIVHTPLHENSESVVIKGFVSVREEDRDGEVTDPNAFDIDAFMATPAIMVNHRLWINSDGNEVGVGVPISLHKVIVKRGGRDEFLIWDVDNRKEVDRFPKDRSPNLSVGDEGLFAYIRVHDPDVVKRVNTGELTAFSWRGKAVPKYVFDERLQKTVKSYEYIDLFEISLVNVPNAPSASFMVDKSAINSLWFDKDKYSRAQAVQALAHYRCSDFKVTENENKYYATGPDAQNFDDNIEGVMCLKMAPGVDMVIQPATVSDLSDMSSVDEVEIQKYRSTLIEEPDMSGTATATAPAVETATPTPEATTEVEKDVATPAAPVPTPAATPEAVADDNEALVAKTVEAVLEKVLPVFEKFGTTIEATNANVASLTEKMAGLQTPETPATPAEPEVSETVQKTAALEQRLAAVLGEVEDVKKSIATITPQRAPRGEVAPATPAPEAQKDPDPNDCFNGMFGVR